jgi:hypothetical protein
MGSAKSWEYQVKQLNILSFMTKHRFNLYKAADVCAVQKFLKCTGSEDESTKLPKNIGNILRMSIITHEGRL